MNAVLTDALAGLTITDTHRSTVLPIKQGVVGAGGLATCVRKRPSPTGIVSGDSALAEYPRVLAYRVDLRLPQGVELPDFAYTNQVISRFFESFTKKIQYHQERVAERGYSRGCKVRYVWSREIGQGGRQHYHLLILLNRDAYYTIGRLGSDRVNMISRIEESWAGALGLPVDLMTGLVHIPKNAEYLIDRVKRQGKGDELDDLFYRASYLCKKATKSYGDRQRGFGTSRG